MPHLVFEAIYSWYAYRCRQPSAGPWARHAGSLAGRAGVPTQHGRASYTSDTTARSAAGDLPASMSQSLPMQRVVGRSGRSGSAGRVRCLANPPASSTILLAWRPDDHETSLCNYPDTSIAEGTRWQPSGGKMWLTRCEGLDARALGYIIPSSPRVPSFTFFLLSHSLTLVLRSSPSPAADLVPQRIIPHHPLTLSVFEHYPLFAAISVQDDNYPCAAGRPSSSARNC